ncbi:hypothetical protein C8R46DRAFT_1038741 [Mycena filopes]|nr:hypothetical protein C8R46DRAFT_1038741 [Mycena filopes]
MFLRYPSAKSSAHSDLSGTLAEVNLPLPTASVRQYRAVRLVQQYRAVRLVQPLCRVVSSSRSVRSALVLSWTWNLWSIGPISPLGYNTGSQPQNPSLLTIKDLHCPFCSKHKGFAYDSDSENEGLDSQNEDNEDGKVDSSKASSQTGWFTRPKRMPEWEYEYIIKTVQPIICKKEGRHLAKPAISRAPCSCCRHSSTCWQN